MAANSNVKVNITTDFDSAGAKAAERELRRVANMQIAASREMAAAEAKVAAQRKASQEIVMRSVGQGMLLVGAAAAAGLALSAKAAMDWETAFAGVRKTVDGTDDEIAQLEDQLRSLAKTLPATHAEIAAVAEAAGQLGVKRRDVAEFTRTMIALGASTNLSAQDAATGLARFSNIMGESNAAAGRLGASIVDLGNNSATTEADILSMGLRIAGAGRTAGLTSGEVLGVAAALSSVGIEAEAGGTAISRVMLQINSDVQSGSDKVESYARVAGMSAQEFAVAWRRDAGGALASFVEGLGKVQESGGNTTAVLDELGFSEIRVADTLRRSALAGDKFRESLDRGQDAYSANVALAEEFNKRLQTTESQLAITRNQVNDAAISIGNNLLPAVAKGAEIVADLAAGFGALPSGIQQAVVVLGVVAAAVGLVGGTAVLAVPKVLALKGALDALNGGTSVMSRALGGAVSFLTGPWGLALAGAGAAVAVLTAVIGANARKQEDMRREAKSLADTLDEVTGAVTDNTRQQIINNLVTEDAFRTGEKYGQSVSDVAEAVFGSSEAFEAWAEGLRAATEGTGSFQTDANGLIETVKSQRDALAEAGVVWESSGEAMAAAGDAAGETTADFEDQTKAIERLIDALDTLNGANQSAEQAEINWQKQLVETNATLAEGAKTLDITTEAGQSNRQAMLDMAEAASDLAEKRLQQSGNEREFRDTLEQARKALYDQARQFFDTDEAAWDYVDTLLQVPSDVTTEVRTPGLTEAQQRAQNLVEILRGLDGTSSTVTVFNRVVDVHTGVSVSAPQGQQRVQADGSVLDFYGSGGLRESHVAQIAPAGAWRVWAEPETGGEAYIPLAPSKRARSLEILGEVANRFGVGGGGASGPLDLTAETIAGIGVAAARAVQRGVSDYDRGRRLA